MIDDGKSVVRRLPHAETLRTREEIFSIQLSSVFRYRFSVVGFWTINGLFVVDFEEGEDAVGVAGGEETAGVGEGVGGAVYIGFGVFAVAGVAEDSFDGLFAVFGMEFDKGVGVGCTGIGCLLEADGVAVGVGEDGIAFGCGGFGEVVEPTCLAHLLSGEGVGEEVGDVDGVDFVFCLGG